MKVEINMFSKINLSKSIANLKATICAKDSEETKTVKDVISAYKAIDELQYQLNEIETKIAKLESKKAGVKEQIKMMVALVDTIEIRVKTPDGSEIKKS